MSVGPASFFKYMTPDTGFAVLDGRCLRWSRPSKFNDPFDMQIDMRMDLDEDAVIRATLDKMWERCNGNAPPAKNALGQMLDLTAAMHLRRGRASFDRDMREGILDSLRTMGERLQPVNDQVRKLLAETKILCLSTVRDSILMWSHYADSHRGLVLEFHVPEGVDSPYKIAREVMYSDRVPSVFTESEATDFLSGSSDIDHRLADRVLYTKAAPWSYEQEWRIATGAGRNADDEFEDAPFDARELRAIYFGCKMPRDTSAGLANLAAQRYPHAELWQATRSVADWSLAFEPFRQGP